MLYAYLRYRISAKKKKTKVKIQRLSDSLKQKKSPEKQGVANSATHKATTSEHPTPLSKQDISVPLEKQKKQSLISRIKELSQKIKDADIQ